MRIILKMTYGDGIAYECVSARNQTGVLVPLTVNWQHKMNNKRCYVSRIRFSPKAPVWFEAFEASIRLFSTSRSESMN